MSMKCEFQSQKRGKTVFLDSDLEKKSAEFFEFIPQIYDYEEAHSHRIKIPYFDDKWRNYIPDFLIKTEWMTCLVEIKPQNKLSDKRNRLKFAAGRQYSKERGWFYLVITDRLIDFGHEFTNIRLLSQYAQHRFPSNEIASLIGFLSQLKQPISMGQCINQLPYKDHSYAHSLILHAAYHHIIHIPISKAPISKESLVSINSLEVTL